MVNFGIFLAYGLMAIGVIAILVFAITRMISNPAAAKNALIGLGGLVVVAGISYAVSSGEDANTVFAKLEVSEGTSKTVGGGLVTFYVLMGLAVLSILYVEVTRLFK